MNTPIFVIGSQRSGTTLLCRMLSAHPDIFIKNELPMINSILVSEKTRETILEELESAIGKHYGAPLNEFLKKHGKSKWGVKDPLFTYFLNCLAKHFSDSKFIVIIRDGRAVTNSNMKAWWGVATNAYSGANLWKKEVALQAEFAKLMGEKCITLKYESLLENTEGELKRICLFLEVPFAEKMMYYFESDGFINRNKMNENVFRAVDSSLGDKWRIELTSYQIGVIENIAGEILEKYGYELAGKKVEISTIKKRYFDLHQKIIGELQLQWQLKVKGLMKSWKMPRT